ncbi:MAG: phosphatidate cytidylyltransferase [Verrucomicrobia bacterium]|nr:phosphatidate cytidylyltransferase [Verrucomicrobiota bacterium]MCH8511210.1 phosphatidate cytidylyltransferase [Kiritimatiellia bacterium]
MKKRLISASALLLTVATAIGLDRMARRPLREIPIFTTALLIGVLLMGAFELRTLFAKWGKFRKPFPIALICIGVPGAFLVALRLRENGLLLLLTLIVVAKMVDNGALLVGSLWGRRHFAPKISPNKTVEGLWGGLIIGTATAMLLGIFLLQSTWLFGLIFGLLISPLAISGDLAASYLKRKAGVKDSGTLLPGIGGVIDLMDSILLSAPLGYFVLSNLQA